MEFVVSDSERTYLRELAKLQLDLSKAPEMEVLKNRWFLHNEGKGDFPIILMETKYCEDDLVDISCESLFARELELGLKRHIINADIIKDDKVIPGHYTIYWETYGWMSQEGILELNNENDYVGSGSYGFSRLLPTEACKRTGGVTPKDLWGNLNSQETVGISSEMFGEFYWPYYKKLAAQFGQLYYGCCEPTNVVWDKYLSSLPNLRKVSVSPWADERFMAERLRGTSVVYCKKPSPNFLALAIPFDEDAYRAHIKDSVLNARGCRLEISCRDIYALHGNRAKLGRAVEIIREIAGEYYK